MRASTLQRVQSTASAAIALASLVAMLVFVVVVNRQVDEITTTRTNSRVVACETDRESAQKVNSLNDRTQELLEQTFNAPRETPRDPEIQAQIDAYLADQRAKFDAVKVEVRKCDPVSIAAYYKGSKP